MTNTAIILGLTVITTALITGLFYGYSCSVNIGLKELPGAEYIAAMQSINRAIQNPVFFISFMGTFFLLPLSTYLNYPGGFSTRFLLILGATILYLVCSFGITIFCNVPLNEALDAFDLEKASPEEINMARINFEANWNNFHFIRTIASVISLILLVIAILIETQPIKIAQTDL